MDNNMEKPNKFYYYYEEFPTGIKEWDGNKAIFQYMNLEYFLTLLFSKKYFINAKKNFDDKNEARLPITPLSFGFTVVGAPISKEQIAKDFNKIDKAREEYSSLGYWPTSCWTHHEKESILMWNAYTYHFGIRIMTNINRFLDNLNYDGFDVYCGFMHYNGYSTYKKLEHNMFSKERMYADEREFRFYFEPKNEDIANRIKEDSHICLDISNLKDFIEEVNLSPYIKKNYALKQLIEDVCHEYGIKVSSSKY